MPFAIVHVAAAVVLGVTPNAMRAQGTPVGLPAPSLEGSTTTSLPGALLPVRVRAALLTSAPELAAHRAALAAADARRAAAGFASPVVLSLESEDAPRGRLDQGSARVEVSRDFLMGTRRRAERELAATGVRAAQVALEAAERRVLARGARAFAQAVGWRSMAGRLAAQDSLLASAETSLRTQFAVGEARYVDVLRLRTERLRVQTEQVAAATESRTGLVALEALLAADSSTRLALPALVDSAVLVARSAGFMGALAASALPSAPSLDSLLALAADVQQATAQVGRAEAARRLLLANQRPALSASVGVQRIGPDGDRGPSVGPVLGASVSLPFTARRAMQAADVAARRDIAAAEAVLDATSSAVRGALAAARERYEAARTRLAGYDAALLQAAREERESALAAYRTGDLSLLELLDFERALSRAEIDRMRAALDALAALTDLLSGSPTGNAIDTETDLVPLPGTTRGTDDR